jgi:hypothetical protein
MSVFNLLETFFFISLGITFVLISLLVYHFRQRIMVLEQKNDTMFEIINNVVTEISNLRNITMNPFQQEPPYQEYAEKIKIIEDEHFRQVHREEDEDEEEDEEDEEEEDEEEEDEDEEEEDEDEDGIEVKVINVNVDSTSAKIEEIADLDIEEIVQSEDDEPKPIEDTILEDDPIIVHKIDETIPLEYTPTLNNSKEIYRNMTMQNLKALVITKGLSTNPSKLKKHELIQLLENSE